jgi:hypothetical protein
MPGQRSPALLLRSLLVHRQAGKNCFSAGRVEVPLRGDVHEDRDLDEGVILIAGEPTSHCFSENPFGGVLVDLVLYPFGEAGGLVDETRV